MFCKACRIEIKEIYKSQKRLKSLTLTHSFHSPRFKSWAMWFKPWAILACSMLLFSIFGIQKQQKHE